MSRDDGAHLRARKLELYDAIQTLKRDHRDGTIDRAVYDETRTRYEHEAADILRRLDASQSAAGVEGEVGPRRSMRQLLPVVAGVLVLLAVGLFLGDAVRARTGSAAITGDVGQATPAPIGGTAAEVAAAQRQVVAHPRDPAAELQLATAYVNAKERGAARAAYVQAIRLDPTGPEARTMYAIFQSSMGGSSKALSQLALVERLHPIYAKAWLVDGLIASRLRGQLPRAVHAWKQFLRLAPRAPVAAQVRVLLASAERALGQRR